MTPNDRKYAKSHEWIKIEGNVGLIGITDHAQKALGDITFVEMPAIGKKISAGGTCGVVESVKAASDIYTPVSGEVVAVNKDVDSAPELINQDPYGKGWILKLRIYDAEQLKSLLDAAGYDATVQEA
jgi:glycine cleavage system H protein